MARDYGQRRPTRQRNSSPHQFLVLALTFLFGYLTATFFDLEKLTHWMNTQVLAEHVAKNEIHKEAAQAAQIPPKPKFEFYTLLANEKAPTQTNSAANHPASTAPVAAVSSATVSVAAKPGSVPGSNQAAQVKVTQAKPIAASTAARGSFLVQVASFKARKDAEDMKGLLTLKGFDVNVVPVTQAKGNWFRVVVGPYPNRLLAQQAQGTLARTERLHGMITSSGG